MDQLVGGQHVDRAAAVGGEQHQVGQGQGGFAEEFLAVLLVEDEEFALDGADGGLGDVAVFGAEFRRPFADMGQDGTEVLEVEQQQTLGIGQGEGDVEHAFLGLGEFQHAGEEDGAHFGDGGADRVALVAEDVPEHRRCRPVGVVGDAEFGGPGFEPGVGGAGHGQAGEVALDVGAEDRDAGGGEGLGHDLQGDGFAGAGGAGDQAVAVGRGEIEQAGDFATGDQQVGHARPPDVGPDRPPGVGPDRPPGVGPDRPPACSAARRMESGPALPPTWGRWMPRCMFWTLAMGGR